LSRQDRVSDKPAVMPQSTLTVHALRPTIATNAVEGPLRQTFFAVFLAFFSLPATSHAQATALGMNSEQLYAKGMNALIGAGLSRNEANAVDYIRRSAELGYAPAQVTLGYFYDTGSVLTREPDQAATWYKKAALQDDFLAEWLLGRDIFLGVGARDLNQAGEWLEKAARHDDPFAQYLLGKIRLERNDYSKAAEWFGKAANQGLPQAQWQLGLLLKQGRGVNEDKFEAYVWLLLSFNAANTPVGPDLQELEAALGSNQVEQAKSKAREMESTVTRTVAAHGCTGWPGEFDAVPTPPPPDLQRFCR